MLMVEQHSEAWSLALQGLRWRYKRPPLVQGWWDGLRSACHPQTAPALVSTQAPGNVAREV
jgi:hypothetical protein